MRALAGWALAVALAAVATSDATAQTLMDPYPHPRAAHAPAGRSAAKHMKACPEFGAGFFRVEGTDTCVKVGGFVEAGVSSRH